MMSFSLTDDGAPPVTKSDPGAFRPFSRCQVANADVYRILKQAQRTFSITELSERAKLTYIQAYNACRTLVKLGVAERDDHMWPIMRGKKIVTYRIVAVRNVPNGDGNKEWSRND